MIKKMKKAFTITELVIVIAVIAILAAVLIPTFSNVISNANESAALQQCTNAMKDYQAQAAEEGIELGNMNGMVFVNNGYVYVYMNGTLHLVDKLDKLASVPSSGKFGKAPIMAGVDFKGDGSALNPSTGYKQIDITFDLTTDEVGTDAHVTHIYMDAQVEKATGSLELADLNLVQVTEGLNPTAQLVGKGDIMRTVSNKLVENLYFYSVNVNETFYNGFFTLEQEVENSGKPAEYKSQAVIYSRQYGAIVKNPTSGAGKTMVVNALTNAVNPYA